MTAIIRRSPGRVLVAPFYRPTRLMEELETMAREVWSSGASVVRAARCNGGGHAGLFQARVARAPLRSKRDSFFAAPHHHRFSSHHCF